MKKKVFFVSCGLFFALVLTLSAQSAGKVTTPDALFEQGLVCLDKGDYNTAIKYFTQTVKLDPTYTDAYTLSGLSHYAKEEYDWAIEDFDKAIDLRDTDAYTWRGFAYAAVGKYRNAIDDLTKAIRYDPTFARAYNQRGLSYLAVQEYTSAIQDFDNSIRLSPDDANAYSGRGFAYLARGDYGKAAENFTSALNRMPKNARANAYNGRGLALYNTGDYDGAISDFAQAIKISPSYANSYKGRALSYSARNDTGDYDNAVADFTQAKRLNPNDITSYNGLIDLFTAGNDYFGAKSVTEERDKRFGITQQIIVTGTVTPQQEFVAGAVQQFAENGILNQGFAPASPQSTSATSTGTVAPQTTPSTPNATVAPPQSPAASQDQGQTKADVLRKYGENIILGNGFSSAAQ